MIARVVVDEANITKSFDYVVPPSMRGHVRVGTRVRVELGPRRVGAWVVDLRPASGDDGDRTLKPIAKITGIGPSGEMIDLCRWVAWRWSGRLVHTLVSASPPVAVAALPPPPPGRVTASGMLAPDALDALRTPTTTVIRVAPAIDVMPVVSAAMSLGPTLVITASVDDARLLAARARRSGHIVAVHPRDWAVAAAGGVHVIGARAAAFAPMPTLAAVVVLDEHDESLQEERVPCWHARDVAIERARRAEVPCLLVSPCPSLEATRGRAVRRPSRNEERAGWPLFDVIDRTREAPDDRGPVSSRLAVHLRGPGRVIAVLNRPGRASLLACGNCRSIARCERCSAAVTQNDERTLVCHRCGMTRPPVCLVCGSAQMNPRKAGVARVAADLRKMLGEPVGVITATRSTLPDERVVIGTEAVLHHGHEASVVCFVSFDDELLAPRLRAHEQALTLLTRAARMVGPRAGGGRVVIQTTHSSHPVIQAALRADPEHGLDEVIALREMLRMPPFAAVATISGPGADEYVERLRAVDLEVDGPSNAVWLARAGNHRELCDRLALVTRPSGRLRVEVDPLRL